MFLKKIIITCYCILSITSLVSGQEFPWIEIPTPKTPVEVLAVNNSERILIDYPVSDKYGIWNPIMQSFIDVNLIEDINIDLGVEWTASGQLICNNNVARKVFLIDPLTGEMQIIFESPDQIRTFKLVDQDKLLLAYRDKLQLYNFKTQTTIASYDHTYGLHYKLVSNSNNHLVYTFAEEQLILFDRNLEVISSDTLGLNYYDIFINQDLLLVNADQDGQIAYSEDLGQSWHDITVSDTIDGPYYEYSLGKNYLAYYHGNHLFVFDLETKSRREPLYTGFGFGFLANDDHLIIKSNSSIQEKKGIFNYQNEELEKLEVNAEDLPLTNNLYALSNEQALMIYFDGNVFYENGSLSPFPSVTNIDRMSDGSIVYSAFDSFYIRLPELDSFTLMPTNFPISSRLTLTRDDILYHFYPSGFHYSLDKGNTWIHDCPSEYFPDFDARPRTIIPKSSKIFYGIPSNSNILSFNYNENRKRVVWANPNYSNYSLDHFDIDATGNLALSYHHKFNGTDYFKYLPFSGPNSSISTPINNYQHFEMDEDGILYIYNSKSVFVSEDKGDTWIDVSPELDADIEIRFLDVADDKTIFLGCKKGNVLKSDFTFPNATSTSDITRDQIKLYPNPVMNQLFLAGHTDQIARLCLSSFHQNRNYCFETMGSNVLDISSIVPGVYVVHIYDKDDNVIAYEKLIKMGR